MAKSNDSFFLSMDEIDVQTEVVGVAANILGGSTAAFVMHKGLDSWKKADGTPVIVAKYRPWIVLTTGLLGRTFIRNNYVANFFSGMATIGGAAGLATVADMKTDWGFLGLGAAEVSQNTPDIEAEAQATAYENYDAVAQAAQAALTETTPVQGAEQPVKVETEERASLVN